MVCCGFTEAVIRLALSALVGVAYLLLLWWFMSSGAYSSYVANSVIWI